MSNKSSEDHSYLWKGALLALVYSWLSSIPVLGSFVRAIAWCVMTIAIGKIFFQWSDNIVIAICSVIMAIAVVAVFVKLNNWEIWAGRKPYNSLQRGIIWCSLLVLLATFGTLWWQTYNHGRIDHPIGVSSAVPWVEFTCDDAKYYLKLKCTYRYQPKDINHAGLMDVSDYWVVFFGDNDKVVAVETLGYSADLKPGEHNRANMVMPLKYLRLELKRRINEE